MAAYVQLWTPIGFGFQFFIDHETLRSFEKKMKSTYENDTAQLMLKKHCKCKFFRRLLMKDQMHVHKSKSLIPMEILTIG